MTSAAAAILSARAVAKRFRRQTGETVTALDGIAFEVAPGTLTALVGPDGAGKTTFLRLACGLIAADTGELDVLGLDVATSPQRVQDRIAYMPQKFGLYEDLSVQENLDLYADLHGITEAERRVQYPRLMEMTALGPFVKRPAGQLSGGMKQKLGLACTLVRRPELLLLDEPTAGVDPLSRHELWQIILQYVADRHTTVVISTSYLDEAERCDRAVVLHKGRILANGVPDEVSRLADGRVFLVTPPDSQPPRSLQARLLEEPDIIDAVPQAGRVRIICSEQTGSQPPSSNLPGNPEITPTPAHFEDGFMILLRKAEPAHISPMMNLEQAVGRNGSDTVIEVHDLVRRFGGFTAVNHISFAVKRGELFGLLGPNGAGKTTTFRMLCGLLPATSGTLRVAGVDLRTARASARQHIGYVAQKFSLYGDLSVRENLDFFASTYGLRGSHKRRRIGWAMQQFELDAYRDQPAKQIPGGFKQRLAIAAALLHEPDILFLDEPTSGADPLARREFWRRITALAEQGVTVIVTTHFMEEAEYCDRVAILDEGRILAQGRPAELRRHARTADGREPTMEDAFIAIVQEGREEERSQRAAAGAA